MLTIGQSIALCRNRNRWTQKRLAAEVGIPQSALSEIENDLVSPKWDIIVAIAACLQVALYALLPLRDTSPAKETGSMIREKDDNLQERVHLLEALLETKDELLLAKEATIALLRQQLNHTDAQ